MVVRRALGRGGDPEVGGLVTTACGSLLVAVITIPTLRSGIDLRGVGRFFAIGMLVPGISQIIFIQSIRFAGAARASVVIGVAPLASVGIALVFLDEPVRWLLLLATVAIVLGGVTLAGERSRPTQFRMLGGVLALVCAMSFAVRDNLVRAATGDVPVLQATLASLLGAMTTISLYLLILRRQRVRAAWRATLPAFAPAGIVLGLAYTFLVLGFDRGRVSVVAPLNATQSLFAVAFAGLVFHDERITRRTVLAGLFVVAGGAIIGAIR